MKYDYSKLKGKIKEVVDTQENLSKIMNVSKTSLSYKLNNNRPFKMSEIDLLINILDIPQNEIYTYFFNKKVDLK